jgi:hypothetical protein
MSRAVLTDGSWADVGRIAAAPGPSPDLLGINAAVLADGAVLAAWSRVTEPSSSNRQGVSSQAFASLGTPGAGFGHRLAITPASKHFGYPQVAAAGDEGFVAVAESNGGRVLLSTRAPGAASLGAPATVSRAGDGDVLLAAGGRHVLVAYQKKDRLRLEVVR